MYKPVAGFFIVGSFVLGCLSISCRAAEIETNHYATYSDAIEDGAVERGWLPEIIPTSAYDIQEQHNLDTNQVWVKFKIPVEDQSSLLGIVNRVSTDEVDAVNVVEPKQDGWWFDETAIRQTDEDEKSLDNVYVTKCEGQNIFDKAYLFASSDDTYWYYWCAN